MKRAIFVVIGILSVGAFFATPGLAGLVTNGDFESGDLTGWTCPVAVCSNANLNQDPYWTSVSNAFPNTGSYGLLVGASDDDQNGNPIVSSISQVLATTAGQKYTLTFSYGEYNANQTLSSESGGPCVTGGPGPQGCYLDPGNIDTSDPTDYFYQYDSLGVLVGGNTVYADSDFLAYQQGLDNDGQGFYKSESVSFTAASNSTTLEFDAFDIQAAVALDSIDVEAAATPEPGTSVLLGAALAGLGLVARHRAGRR